MNRALCLLTDSEAREREKQQGKAGERQTSSRKMAKEKQTNKQTETKQENGKNAIVFLHLGQKQR